MRERTTWNSKEIKRTAALPKKADPYTMNQDPKNPPAEKYMNGDPSSWAEDVHTPNDWDKDYSGGEVKRNEIGEPEMRSDAKTASDNVLLVKKADLCVKIAREMFRGRKATEQRIEDQAVALMALPDSDVIDTYTRLANDEQEQGQEQGQPQQAQAAQQEEEQAAPQQQQAQASGLDQAMMAAQQGDMDGLKSAIQAMVQTAVQSQQQQMPQAPQQQMMAASKKKADQGQQQEQAPAQQEAQATTAVTFSAAQQEAVQAMIQSAIQAAMPTAVTFADQQQQGAPPPPMEAEANDEETLDQMLASAPADTTAGGEIELDPSPMDVGEAGLGAEDDALKMLFATEESQDEEQVQQAKQAALRTASNRTVGTKPTAGVARLGGLGGQSKTAASRDVDNLSSLWASAPDVREHFGIK